MAALVVPVTAVRPVRLLPLPQKPPHSVTDRSMVDAAASGGGGDYTHELGISGGQSAGVLLAASASGREGDADTDAAPLATAGTVPRAESATTVQTPSIADLLPQIPGAGPMYVQRQAVRRLLLPARIFASVLCQRLCHRVCLCLRQTDTEPPVHRANHT